MTDSLFGKEPKGTDHPFYTNLGSTSFRPDIREWCDAAYSRCAGMLDEDFSERFRRDTSQRFSELFFASAFLEAGWDPIDRVKGFDLAFRHGEGRLLVEITTPDPPPPDSWHTEVHDNGVTLWSADEASEDAALRRLTGGFASKAELIRKLGSFENSDYVVIAISGLRISQETPIAPEIGGPVPQFAKAFLPIGSQYVRFRLGERPDEDKATESGYLFKATIDQSGKTPVDRDFFLRPDFEHINAVVYTPLHFGGPSDGPPKPVRQCAVLHNPMSKTHEPLKLGVGEEYCVRVEESQFTLIKIYG
jgi:hypothetical protein